MFCATLSIVSLTFLSIYPVYFFSYFAMVYSSDNKLLLFVRFRIILSRLRLQDIQMQITMYFPSSTPHRDTKIEKLYSSQTPNKHFYRQTNDVVHHTPIKTQNVPQNTFPETDSNKLAKNQRTRPTIYQKYSTTNAKQLTPKTTQCNAPLTHQA
jgi:hypothetical protein